MGHDNEIGALAGFTAEALIRYDERRARHDHQCDRLAELGRDVDPGQHLRRGLWRRRIARPVVFDLAPPRLAVAAALLDIAHALGWFAGHRDDIPAQYAAVGPGEFKRAEHVGS